MGECTMSTQKTNSSYDSNEGELEYALFSRGIYYITGMIDEDSLLLIHQDVLLKHLDPTWTDDIQLIINSPGGLVSEGHALIDLLDWVNMDVRTVGMGECASMATMLLCSGTHGKRVVTPNASLMIHGAKWEAVGSKYDIAVVSQEMNKLHQKDVEFWMQHSIYKTPEDIEKYFLHGKNDVYLSPEEALAHGIVDGIVGSKKNSKQ